LLFWPSPKKPPLCRPPRWQGDDLRPIRKRSAAARRWSA
jgi:hypothetical protein